MSRTYGCPFDIKDYSVSVRSQFAGAVRVKGLETMSIDVDAETDDGRAVGDMWSEKFIRSRGVSGSLEGRPIVDRSTGAKDPGQKLLHRAAHSDGGCENDYTLIVADAVGHAVEYDCVFTKETLKADEDGETISWDWEGVGSPRELAYVQTERIEVKRNDAVITTLSLRVGAREDIRVNVLPNDASNRRFAYYLADEAVAQIVLVDEGHMAIMGMSPGRTTLNLRTMNHQLTWAVEITVTAT